MKGYVEIFSGRVSDDHLIYSDYNMIVDGAGEHIIDVLTTIPTPSSLAVNQVTAASAMGIKAMTLGSASGSTSYNSYSPSADSGPSSLMPVVPTPIDRTLQPVTASGPGRLGHFLNYYNFSGSYPSLTEEDIREHGCYLPSAGIDFAASTFGSPVPNDMSGLQTGDLNSAGAINSEGFILESPVARASQTLADASGGFIVSGIGDVSATREIKYILTISYRDWKFLDYYYGGIGAIGLWTLDMEETRKRYNDETDTSEIDLYNVADISRNPAFKLFSKKVFLPGGLKLDEASANDDYITITWGIKF